MLLIKFIKFVDLFKYLVIFRVIMVYFFNKANKVINRRIAKLLMSTS
jgi:hypothetical protein